MPYKTWEREHLLSSEVQKYFMDQSVLQFATASQRQTEVPNPKVGMLSWLDIPGQFEGYTKRGTWEPLGPLRVSSRAALPTQGALGMEAVETSGQRWVWRSVYGVEQWTWPREAQGVLARQLFPGNQFIVNTVGLFSAIKTADVSFPAGRHICASIDGSLWSNTAGVGYGLLLEFAGLERRAIVNMPAANWPSPVHCEMDLQYEAGRSGVRLELAGGLIYGSTSAAVYIAGVPTHVSDGPFRVQIEDKGSCDTNPQTIAT